MSSALKRGRTLNHRAVKDAQKWREKRLEYLESRPTQLLSWREWHEMKHLQAQRGR